MTVTDIRDARAARCKVKMVSAAKMDLMIAGSTIAAAMQINLIAQYLLETGRHADAGGMMACAEELAKMAGRLKADDQT